jgi:uncharacterized protein YdiU (UPF0061 family)
MLKNSSYFQLPDNFYSRETPHCFKDPQIVSFNSKLSFELNLNHLKNDPLTLSGQNIDTDALSLAYAGHQFGHFVPQLGDGRAHLLGEIDTPAGRSIELQLKGSGQTRYSRAGDGRSPLGAVLKEYLFSQLLHSLGIPTTRSLAALTTGEEVMRELPQPGGLLVRSARSHLRVGSFEYFAARGDQTNLHKLMLFACEKLQIEPRTPESLFEIVLKAQAKLVAKWMSVGFIHGVMNTDNMSLVGETIDYGPCAFMDHFNPDQKFSYIDRLGRYRYNNQPQIAHWNLSVFASCLSLLANAPQALQERLDQWHLEYEQHLLDEFGMKFGLDTGCNKSFLNLWLDYLTEFKLDFTSSHRDLVFLLQGIEQDQFPVTDRLVSFVKQWKDLRQGQSDELTSIMLQTANPCFVLRNHHVVAAMEAAENGSFDLYFQLLNACESPFQMLTDFDQLYRPPGDDEKVIYTYCGT